MMSADQLIADEYFHLSRRPRVKGIVATTDGRGKSPKFHTPRECLVHGDEAADARLCVAPTVWQCLTSMTDNATLFIYSIKCVGAFQPLPEHTVEDASASEEHWITDSVIEQNNGLIPVKQVGIIRRDHVSVARNRILAWMQKKAKDFCTIDERGQIWIVDSSCKPNEWRLRDSVRVDEIDVEPLVPPSWDWES